LLALNGLIEPSNCCERGGIRSPGIFAFRVQIQGGLGLLQAKLIRIIIKSEGISYVHLSEFRSQKIITLLFADRLLQLLEDLEHILPHFSFF